VRLCGPRSYDGELANEPWLNAGARDPTAADVTRGLELYVTAMFALTLLLVMLAIV
jgi:adenosylcobinamide-phosphate synthase